MSKNCRTCSKTEKPKPNDEYVKLKVISDALSMPKAQALVVKNGSADEPNCPTNCISLSGKVTISEKGILQSDCADSIGARDYLKTSAGWVRVTQVNAPNIYYKNISIPVGTELARGTSLCPQILDLDLLQDILCSDDCPCVTELEACPKIPVCDDGKVKLVDICTILEKCCCPQINSIDLAVSIGECLEIGLIEEGGANRAVTDIGDNVYQYDYRSNSTIFPIEYTYTNDGDCDKYIRALVETGVWRDYADDDVLTSIEVFGLWTPEPATVDSDIDDVSIILNPSRTPEIPSAWSRDIDLGKQQMDKHFFTATTTVPAGESKTFTIYGIQYWQRKDKQPMPQGYFELIHFFTQVRLEIYRK